MYINICEKIINLKKVSFIQKDKMRHSNEEYIYMIVFAFGNEPGVQCNYDSEEVRDKAYKRILDLLYFLENMYDA